MKDVGMTAETDRLLVMRPEPARMQTYRLAPERIVGTAPEFVSWDIEQTADGKISAGFWEATPGAWQTSKDGEWEFCHLISGVVEVTETGKAPVRLQAGDSFVMRPGFSGVWHVIETVRKSFVIYAA